MPTAYAGRLVTIFVVLYLALCCVFPRAPFSVFQWIGSQPASLEHNLRPGIDMVGGTSLVYEIEAPEGAAPRGGPPLSEQVATALKRRVDPNGVLNLIWRPQGDRRLEIQLPLSRDSGQAEGLRDRFLVAQEQLKSLNVPPRQIVRTIESTDGTERDAALDRLAGNSESRRAAYAEVATAYDALRSARESGSIVAIDEAEAAYREATAALGGTNLPVEVVQAAVQATPEVREEQLARLREQVADYPDRAAALEEYVEAAVEYEAVRDEIADTATLKRLLQGSGVLQFAILAADVDPEEYDRMADRLRTVGPRPSAGDDLRWFVADNEEATRLPTATLGPDGQTYLLAYNDDARTLDDRDGDWGLTRASQQPDESGLRAVGFQLDALGASLFGDLSGGNVGRPLAIILDDRVISAPQLNGRITGNGIITGGRSGFSNTEQAFLVNTLNAGALPARLSEEPISERTVGPQLGRDNLVAGLVACVAGLIIVAVFLTGYYYTLGLVAFGAVCINMLIILASMAALQASFTLPSIAGIILSIGMSVDANVLIFERLREEQARGLSIRMALRNAYDRAFSAILDSNVTTGITALILYVFGSEEVKGFGLTLLIGIFASLFTALYVTKTVYGLMIDKADKKDFSSLPRTFPRWDKFLTPNIDWMRWTPIFGAVSAALIVGGLACFAYFFNAGRVLDIEFAGGTTAQFELREPKPIGEVRAALESDDPDDELAGVQVVSIEPSADVADDTMYEAVVPNQDDAEVTAAIVSRLGESLDVRRASVFEGYSDPYQDVADRLVVPIEPDATEIAGLPVDPDLIAVNSGGAAIVLRDLTPMLDADVLERRITEQRLKGRYDAEGLRAGANVDVETFPGRDAAVVLVSNDRFRYDAGDADVAEAWRAELAAPSWRVAVDAVSNPDELQKVTNIGAQVAGEFQRDATLAVILSVLAIMGYIWVRFGDLKYSTATVVALAHDTLFCIAGIGYAHLLADTFLGDAFMLDPFRVNLTMVAAILTVMGFSMNDTVVVFDRIRENRGKYGTLTRGVVNDSINQTLSRTLLTGGTTLVTIFVMYLFGGPGIHGFTFAMLVGIITGTYSSIAIASPILLLGRRRDEEAGEPTEPTTPTYTPAAA